MDLIANFHFAILIRSADPEGVDGKRKRQTRGSELSVGAGPVFNEAVERGRAERLLRAGYPATEVATKTGLPYSNVAAMARSFPSQAKGRKPDRSILHSQSIRALEVLLAYRNEQTAHWWNVKAATAALEKEFEDCITERKSRVFLGWSGIAEDSIRITIADALEKVRWRAIEDISKQIGEIEACIHRPEGLSDLKKELDRLEAADRSSRYLACYTLAKSPTRLGWPTIRVYATRGLRGHGKSEFFRVTLADDSAQCESLPHWGGRPPVKVFTNLSILPNNEGDTAERQQVLVHLQDANRLIRSEAAEAMRDLEFLLDH
jgi:hypothetical protein